MANAPHNVRVLEHFEDGNLAPDPFDVLSLLHPLLFEHLHRHFLRCDPVGRLEDCAERALAEAAAYHIVPHLLILSGSHGRRACARQGGRQ
jgi:hypothetical protein